MPAMKSGSYTNSIDGARTGLPTTVDQGYPDPTAGSISP